MIWRLNSSNSHSSSTNEQSSSCYTNQQQQHQLKTQAENQQQQPLLLRRSRCGCFLHRCCWVIVLVHLSLSATTATSFSELHRQIGRQQQHHHSLSLATSKRKQQHQLPRQLLSIDSTQRNLHTSQASKSNDDNDYQQAEPMSATTSASAAAQESTASSSVVRGGGRSVTAVEKGWLTRARETVFPIYGSHEVTKFVLIGSIKFFVILALTLTRDTKDTLVVTQCGAEAIAFLKIYGVLPAATAFIALYSKLSNVLSKKALFYTTCIPFFVFFAAFDWLIYPNVDVLHPSLDMVRSVLQPVFGLAATKAAASGVGALAVLTNICAHWTSAVFYVMAEIYSSVSVGILFWQFANDVVDVDQAKRFYPLFAQMSGLAPVLAGQYVVRFASRAPNFAISFRRLTYAVTLSGIAICIFYQASSAYVERTEGGKSVTDSSATKVTKKKKPKLGMMESAKFLAGSQYLRLIATLVLGYGLSINFTEIMWKSLVKRQYPNPLDYQRFMGNFSSIVGASTCVVIFFGVHVIRLLGWRVGAMATPAVMAVIAVPFFACILLGLDSPARLQTAVLCGTILSLLSKTAKYALFDPTTQMAYIPLDDESKVKGKAAIDVLGSRIGKSGGSLIQQGLVFGFGNILSAAPAVLMFYYGVLLTWISAASRLSGLFQAQTEVEKASRRPTDESKKDK